MSTDENRQLTDPSTGDRKRERRTRRDPKKNLRKAAARELVDRKEEAEEAASLKIVPTVLTVLFAAIAVAVFIGNQTTRGMTYSESENRSLAKAPHISFSSVLDGSFFKDLEDYYSDHFVGRDKWISVDFTKNRILGQKETADVYFGKDDYLLSKAEKPDQQKLAGFYSAMNSFMALNPDLTSRMVVVPGAQSILTDNLPEYAPYHDQMPDINAVGDAVGEMIPFYNAGDILALSTQDQIYYRTDHHWTTRGCYDFFINTAGFFGIENPIQEYRILTVSDSFEGTLASKTGSHKVKDQIQLYVPQTDVQYYVEYPDTGHLSATMYVSAALEQKDQYTVFFGGNHGRVNIHTTAGNGRNLLVFKDSYANCFMQFLTPYYENIVMIDPRYYYDNVQAIISQEGITDILFLYSADTLFTDSSLTDALEAAVTAAAVESPQEAAS